MKEKVDEMSGQATAPFRPSIALNLVAKRHLNALKMSFILTVYPLSVGRQKICNNNLQYLDSVSWSFGNQETLVIVIIGGFCALPSLFNKCAC